MDRATATTLLKAHNAELRRTGVQRLYLFGSTARDEARPDSGVDLFFDHEWGKLSLFDVMEIQEVMVRVLGCPTDATTRQPASSLAGLHRNLRDFWVLMNAPGVTRHPRHRAHTSPRRLVRRRM